MDFVFISQNILVKKRIYINILALYNTSSSTTFQLIPSSMFISLSVFTFWLRIFILFFHFFHQN